MKRTNKMNELEAKINSKAKLLDETKQDFKKLFSKVKIEEI